MLDLLYVIQNLDEILLLFIHAHPKLALILTLAIIAFFGILLQLTEEKKDTTDVAETASVSSIAKCPCMTGTRCGSYRTQGLPAGDHPNLKMCKRDFARFTTPGRPFGIFMVTASESTPKPWLRQTQVDEGDKDEDEVSEAVVTELHAWLKGTKDDVPEAVFTEFDAWLKSTEDEVSEAVFAEFEAWLKKSVKNPTNGLAERCIALFVIIIIDFAMKHPIQPPFTMDQPTFILMVNARNEVRIAWFTFLVDAAKSDKKGKQSMLSGPYMLKTVTEDLNSRRAQAAEWRGVTLEFAAGPTGENDMASYVQDKTAAEFSRAVVENDCADLLQFMNALHYID